MLEMVLIMMSLLYSTFFSMKFLLLFPLALAIYTVRNYIEKRNR